MEYVSCGLCQFKFGHGAHVCQGCQGDIIYGATKAEEDEAFKIGAVIGAICTAAAVYGVPYLINEAFGVHIAVGFGLEFYGLLVAGIAGLAGGMYSMNKVQNEKAQQVRTFRRTFNR